jgi:replicative superfamily II helicase
MKYYLLEKSSSVNAKKFLAFFIVPRRAMLKQQAEKLKQFGNLRVVSYEESNDAIQYINKYDVIVCTPQRLLE